ncbi:hypothetical protein PMAYCL1PPCAC_08337, partial [Pristionchus mayeri]
HSVEPGEISVLDSWLFLIEVIERLILHFHWFFDLISSIMIRRIKKGFFLLDVIKFIDRFILKLCWFLFYLIRCIEVTR